MLATTSIGFSMVRLFFITPSLSLICILGVNIVLYAQTMYIYASSKSSRQRSPRFFVSFSTLMLVLITIYIITQSILGGEMWIVNANYPGGSAAYLAANASDWYQTMGTTSSVILQLMSDGLLVSRFCDNWWLADIYGLIDIPVLGCLAGPENHPSPLFPLAGNYG